jgi:2'-hydroxyisoflavone reductase
MSLDRRDFLKGALTGGVLAAGASMGLAGIRPTAARAHYTPADKKLRILILGGTAFLGPAVVYAARRRGHEITLFNRGKTNANLFPDLETLIGDRDAKIDPLRGRDWDAVVDTSGYFPRLVKDSARLLADHVQQYAFISSISVYSRFDEPGIDEDFPVGTIDDPSIEKITEGSYGPLKALCEQEAEKALPGRVTNIRPGLIVGPRDRSDRFTYWPVRVSKGGEVLAPNSPKDGIQIMDVNDLGEWIVYCLENKVVGVYNAVSPAGWLDIGGLLDTCKRVSGSDASFTWVSSKFLDEHEVQGWTEMTCWMPPEGEYSGFGKVSVDRAVAHGLAFRPISETVRTTLDWWKTLPEERREKMRAGLAAEKEEKVLAAWHEIQKG